MTEQQFPVPEHLLDKHIDTQLIAALEAKVEELTLRLAGEESIARSYMQKLMAAHSAIQQAITWLVVVKTGQPASIIAERARLALEALQAAGKARP